MSRPPADPTEKILELYLTLSHPERAMLLKFIAAFTKIQASDIEPTKSERQAVKKRATKSEEPMT